MADEVDRTQERMEHIEALQKMQRDRKVTKVSNTFCDDCDDEIPEERRIAVPGVELCIHCQLLYEAKYGRG
jgi:phage/conjugal plasmid C-4 type zinc finger TraR family protein